MIGDIRNASGRRRRESLRRTKRVAKSLGPSVQSWMATDRRIKGRLRRPVIPDYRFLTFQTNYRQKKGFALRSAVDLVHPFTSIKKGPGKPGPWLKPDSA
jgi:hypothetical protein